MGGAATRSEERAGQPGVGAGNGRTSAGTACGILPEPPGRGGGRSRKDRSGPALIEDRLPLEIGGPVRGKGRKTLRYPARGQHVPVGTGPEMPPLGGNNTKKEDLPHERTVPAAQGTADGRGPGALPGVPFLRPGAMRSLDEEYPFSVDRNFYYLTGLERENMALVLEKDVSGRTSQALYIEPYDEYLAKWVGGRMRPEEAGGISGVETVLPLERHSGSVHRFLDRSRGVGPVRVYLDLWRYKEGQADTPAHKLADRIRREYPYAVVEDVSGRAGGYALYQIPGGTPPDGKGAKGHPYRPGGHDAPRLPRGKRA